MTYEEIKIILLQNKLKILKITALSAIVLFSIIFLVLPNTYSSTVTILPPEKKSDLGGIGGLIAGQDVSGLLFGGMANANSQLFVEILRSRSAALYVADKHNLTSFYDEEDIFEAAYELNKNLKIDLTKEGIIKLNVDVKTSYFPKFSSDTDSVKALSASLSNSFVEALDKINRVKLTSKAKRAREYIENQLHKTRAALDSVETQLTLFQQTNKTISLPEQLKAAIEAASKLKAEIVKTEIEIGLMQTNLREDNQVLVSMRRKLNELQEQFNKMELGNQDYILAFGEVPDLGKRMAALLREVKIQNEVYLLLQQQYYKEKIQENRDIPTVDVLDEAIIPKEKSAPRTVFSTAVGSLFILIAVSSFLVYDEKRKISRKEKVNA
jgi:tyrosine-protein kinase Etk/Wzc